MINLIDVTIANKAIQVLDGVSTFMVQSKPGSAVAALDSITPTEAAITAKGEGGIFVPMDLVEGTSRKNIMGVFEHDAVLENLVDKTWQVLDQRIKVTRDRAIPMATAIIAGLNKVYNLSYTEANVYTIVEIGLASGLSSSLITRLVDQYADSPATRTPINNNSSTVRLESKNDSLGISNALAELFDKNYRNESDGLVIDSSNLNDLVMQLFWDTTDLALTYANGVILARRLMTADILLNADELPSGITGYATAINNFLKGEAVYAAKQLKLLNGIRDTRINRKNLIDSVDQYELRISVNAEVYQAWLGMGGTADALIGYVVAGGSMDNHYDAILDNINGYTEAYNVAKLKLFDSIQSNQLILYKKNFPYQLQAALSEDGFSADDITSVLAAAVKDITVISTPTGDRFYMEVLAIISRHVYPGIGVYDIAREMNRIGIAIPGISPEQASALVCSDMLLDYIASQYDVIRVV